jgi:hypothetical protein
VSHQFFWVPLDSEHERVAVRDLDPLDDSVGRPRDVAEAAAQRLMAWWCMLLTSISGAPSVAPRRVPSPMTLTGCVG